MQTETGLGKKKTPVLLSGIFHYEQWEHRFLPNPLKHVTVHSSQIRLTTWPVSNPANSRDKTHINGLNSSGQIETDPKP